MAVEIIPANDGNPPKYRLVRLSEKKQLIIIGALVIPLILGIFSKELMALLYVLVGFAGFFYICFYMPAKTRNTAGTHYSPLKPIHEYYKNVAIQNGFNIDYEAQGLLVDEKRKKLAFTTSLAGLDRNTKIFNSMLVCDFSDVMKWKNNVTEFTSRTPTHVSVDPLSNRATVTGGHEKLDVATYEIQVTINYPKSPLQTFQATSDADASIWLARLNSLING